MFGAIGRHHFYIVTAGYATHGDPVALLHYDALAAARAAYVDRRVNVITFHGSVYFVVV